MRSASSHQDVSGPRKAAGIADLFPIPVAAFCLDGAGDPSQLTPVESRSIGGAGAGRLAQFAAGRSCARAALTELGWDGASIPRLEDRRPRWPEGVLGSISHTTGRAVSVAARIADAGGRRIGIDVEQLGRVRPRLERRLFGDRERLHLSEIDHPETRVRWATASFGVKEAFYKAQFEHTAAWVGFHDVEVSWFDDGPSPERSSAVWRGEIHPERPLPGFDLIGWPVEVAALFDEPYVITAATVRPARLR